jgi:hypothetical protein
MTLREGDDPGHQPFWRNLHPAAAACGRILHYAVPHRAYYPGQDAHQEVLDAVQRAVAAGPELRFPAEPFRIRS